MGGSFNPAHKAHTHISLMALKRLRLNQIWWIISPQNPLKDQKDTAPIKKRVYEANLLINNPNIKIGIPEIKFNNTYTFNTLKKLKMLNPYVHFVWLMGADNLASFHLWKKWTTIFENIPIAVFDRPKYSNSSISSKAAQTFSKYRIKDSSIENLVLKTPPAWYFFHSKADTISSSFIRKELAQSP